MAAAPTAASPAAHSGAGATGFAPPLSAGPSAIRNSRGSISSEPIATSGSTDQNTQRHPTLWVRNAATLGPTNDGSTQAAEIQENIVGRHDSSKARAITTYIAIEVSPLPKPCSNRPLTSCSIVGAVAATTIPTLNRASPPAIGRAGPIRSHSRPAPTVANN